MSYKIDDLKSYLFAQLDRLDNKDLKEEELKAEIDRSRAVTTVAKAIIDADALVLDAVKAAHQVGYDMSSTKKLIPLLEEKE